MQQWYTLGVRVTREYRERVLRQAALNEKTVSEYIRSLIDEDLKNGD